MFCHLMLLDECPAYITSHLILPINPVKNIPGKFVNKTCNIFHTRKTY